MGGRARFIEESEVFQKKGEKRTIYSCIRDSAETNAGGRFLLKSL